MNRINLDVGATLLTAILVVSMLAARDNPTESTPQRSTLVDKAGEAEVWEARAVVERWRVEKERAERLLKQALFDQETMNQIDCALKAAEENLRKAEARLRRHSR
jgi:multidrug resistance efflux pump